MTSSFETAKHEHLLRSPRPARACNENEWFASPGGSVIPGTLWARPCASTEGLARRPKIRLITIGLLRDLSEIKLKRTDTTLDLSQKATGKCSLAHVLAWFV
ncbi:hypothetical protein SODALDRAFT_121899 [Sodiomyces alkalinus F11]|uniref:Uncharacterized protein n=1 Tax=Sodiomyces alkalinus (strain CBS 110278 / VKM F-3762 / F11) TaxID=1314773 RepID=A0A3N2Q450_SODAK|nr:hypothetical protein SODALDRAFT_121899 [Sodiomyces alkalinus F11]ROT41533.1 hypothetical protein SODALDRAFT_121899 [Sodiomyces alkalinus F11]